MHEIFAKFWRSEGKKKILKLFLHYGVSIKKGKACLGEIELCETKIAKAVGVDRRVVKALIKEIEKDDKLAAFFYNLEARAFLGEAGKVFGMDTIRIKANPKAVGIIAKVSSVLAKHNISIRQIVADDPYLFPEPVLHVVVDGKISGEVIDEIRKIKEIKEVTLK